MYSLWISVVSLLNAECTRNAHHDCLKALNASSFAVRFSNHITLVVTVKGVLCAYLKYLREVRNISCHELATIRTFPQPTRCRPGGNTGHLAKAPGNFVW